MATGFLIVLTVVLVAAACYVGLLLLRRSRPATQAQSSPTVGDLVRRRTAPPEKDLSGTDLFTPKHPKASGATRAPADEPGGAGPGTTGVVVPQPTSPPAATPPGGVEAGDAPWRRAARMMGSEPGAAWETAPIPLVAAAQPAQAVQAGATAVIAVPEQTDAPSIPSPAGAHRVDVAPETPTDTPPTDTPPTDTAPPADESTSAPQPAPSRPLSDPDLTPLMGIPVIRTVAESPAPPPAVAGPTPEPGPAPVTPRLSRPSAVDDEVVSFLPARPAPRAAATGSPQPVWFRVVRRDGEPVEGVVVTLLDDHGHEADVTKTATDGGGELRAPHGGWFLMIASADGFQPRAVTLSVDEQPVEIALLLPRSATVAGAVRDGGAPAAEMRVVAFQEGEVVDEVVTDPGGGFRFDDLAEGVYALSASGARGSAVGRVTLTEGADAQLDLDLRRP